MLVVQPGVRVDRYNRFGTAWSPAVAASGWIVPNVRWRTATGQSFRIPTYTELYYRDPNHQASDDLVPERAWSADAGVDAFAGGWTASVTAFGRWDADVIDWVRATPTERWHTTNIRDVDTRGVELGLSRRARRRRCWSVRYTGQHAEAPTLALLSKYVLDFAPHALSMAGATTWRRLDLGSHVTYTRRADGRDYWVADVRVARPLRPGRGLRRRGQRLRPGLPGGQGRRHARALGQGRPAAPVAHPGDESSSRRRPVW